MGAVLGGRANTGCVYVECSGNVYHYAFLYIICIKYPSQDEIPEGGTPLGIYLYADKSKLSSFGTQQGYPVVMRITNIEANVRHGVGFGGGHVVGFLPLVSLILFQDNCCY